MTPTAIVAYSAKRNPGEPPRPCSGLPAAVPKAATQARALLALLKTEVSRAQLVHQLENAPATAGHAGQRVIRHHDREPGLLGEQLVDVAQQRATAGEHDATLGDVRAQLRRSLLERLLHGTHDALQRLLQCLENLVAVQRKAARHALGEVAAFHRQFAHLLPGIGRTDFDLDALGGRLADEDAVVAAHVVHDRLVHAITADARGVGVHHAIQRQHGNLGGAAANIEHHRAARFVHRQSRAHRRGHRLTHDRHVARARAFGRLADGAPLHLRRTERHTHPHARRGLERAVAVHLVDEELQHLLGVGEVGDHTVLHGTHGRDVPGRAPEHGLGLGADGDDHLAAAPGLVLHRDHGGFVEHDAPVADIDQRIRRTEIDRQIARKITAQAFEHEATGNERRETPKVARNLATERTFSKATCMILRWFSPFATRAANLHAPLTRADREHRCPGAARPQLSRDPGVPGQPVADPRLRRRPGARRHPRCRPDVAAAARPVAASAAGRGDRVGPPRAVSGERAPGRRRPVPGAQGHRVRPSVSAWQTSTLTQLAAGLRARKFSSVELVRACLERIDASQAALNAFISVTREQALSQAAAADRALAAGGGGALTGVPIAHKDIFCTQGVRTTCGSRILDNFVSPYAATVVAKLRGAGAIMLGKINMDEFAMGSSSETSFYGPVRNPWNPQLVPGGSSGGSAAAVAARLVPGATATDTGGSIRQPAALCGITGLKPTYGRVSRYGMIAFASSLDQGGVLTVSAADAALMLREMAGFDANDSTSVDTPVPDYVAALEQPLAGLKVGLLREFFDKGLDAQNEQRVREALRVYEQLGARLTEVSLPNLPLSVPVYYVVAPAECSSNLARFDGVRFGYRCENPRDLTDLYRRSRGEGFGAEVKRRIMTGTYVLSAGYYDAYYLKAQRVRQLINADFARAFGSVDVLMGPTTPTPAFAIGAKTSDPITMYLNDIYTIGANLAGLPAVSVPCGFVQGLPVGLQIVGPHFSEARVLNAAHALQRATDWHTRVPPGYA